MLIKISERPKQKQANTTSLAFKTLTTCDILKRFFGLQAKTVNLTKTIPQYIQ